MKKLLYIFILTSVLISCSSDDNTEIDNSELIGKWEWISSCGGFTGDCWYPSEDNYESLEFTQSKYILKINGVIDTETTYSIVDQRINGSDILYVMELKNERTIRFRFISGQLNIEGGDFWKEYERTE